MVACSASSAGTCKRLGYRLERQDTASVRSRKNRHARGKGAPGGMSQWDEDYVEIMEDLHWTWGETSLNSPNS